MDSSLYVKRSPYFVALSDIRDINFDDFQGKLSFLGNDFVVRKNGWRGNIIPKKSERVVTKLSTTKRQSWNQQLRIKILLRVSQDPAMKDKTKKIHNLVTNAILREIETLATLPDSITPQVVNGIIEKWVNDYFKISKLR